MNMLGKTPKSFGTATQWTRPAAAGFLAALLLSAGHALAHFDPGFGTNGKASAGAGPSFEHLESFGVLPDGKQVLIGACDYTYSCVMKLNADGTPDLTFNQTGRLALTSRTGGGGFVQPDGKIVVLGSNCGNGSVPCLLRLNADGSVDSSFNGSGMASFPPTPQFENTHISLLQSDGKILTVGRCGSTACAVRHRAEGSLDTTYGVEGVFRAPVSTQATYVSGAAIQVDGKLILDAGCGTAGPCLLRVREDGHLDAHSAMAGLKHR
jgi:uncharacterized delta-60 repeat protein